MCSFPGRVFKIEHVGELLQRGEKKASRGIDAAVPIFVRHIEFCPGIADRYVAAVLSGQFCDMAGVSSLGFLKAREKIVNFPAERGSARITAYLFGGLVEGSNDVFVVDCNYAGGDVVKYLFIEDLQTIIVQG